MKSSLHVCLSKCSIWLANGHIDNNDNKNADDNNDNDSDNKNDCNNFQLYSCKSIKTFQVHAASDQVMVAETHVRNTYIYYCFHYVTKSIC